MEFFSIDVEIAEDMNFHTFRLPVPLLLSLFLHRAKHGSSSLGGVVDGENKAT